MYPVIFRIGTFELRTYGVAMALAFLINIWLGARRAKKEGIDPDLILGVAFWLIIGTVVGGRLLFVITTWKENFADNPLSALYIWQGGLVFYGGFLASFIASVLYIGVYRKKLGMPVYDILAPYVGLGYAIHRAFGCFLNGCCYGAPTDLPWGVNFPPNHPAHQLYGAQAHIHPTQLYMAISGLVIFYFLVFWRANFRKRYGELLGLLFMIYAINRFLIEFVRGDPIRGHIGSLSTSQFMGFFVFVFGLLIFIFARKKGIPVGKESEYLSNVRSPFLKEKFRKSR